MIKYVGYWRPLKDASEWQDPQVPEVIDRPWSPALRSAERDLADCRAGRHVALYVSADDMRRANADTKEGYLEWLVERARARAEADYALPVPLTGTLATEQAEALAAWLDGGRATAHYHGGSTCRVCGGSNGSSELERDGYRYPEGLVHYVREHRVAVPGLEAVLASLVEPGGGESAA